MNMNCHKVKTCNYHKQLRHNKSKKNMHNNNTTSRNILKRIYILFVLFIYIIRIVRWYYVNVE